MKIARRITFAAAGILLLVGSARAASEIVIAIRYLQAEGVSHSHLYLYRDDGKFLRQLTNENSGQDVDPIFAPNGEEIVTWLESTRSRANGQVAFLLMRPKLDHHPRRPCRHDPNTAELAELLVNHATIMCVSVNPGRDERWPRPARRFRRPWRLRRPGRFRRERRGGNVTAA